MWKFWGLFFWGLLAAQGWESLKDSLLIENERIETLELEQRPLPQLPRIERPVWSMEAAVWDSIPTFPLYKPTTIPPARPIWTKRAPLHASYGLGRFWTHMASLSWGRTRDLRADEGISLTHTSTSMGHVRFARWGHTHLTGWIGRYAETRGWEAVYRGGFEKFIFYAPYAERWVGFGDAAPLIDSLRGHYWRQELRLRLYERRIGEVHLISRRLDWRTGAPEWQVSLTGESRRLKLAEWHMHTGVNFFIQGKRFLVGSRLIAARNIGAWSITGGLRLAGGQDSTFKFLAAPLLRVIYTNITPYLRPYIETRGDLTPLTYFSASEINPYLTQVSGVLPFSREWINAQVGIQGQGAGWEYRLAGEYRFIQGALFFLPQGAMFAVQGISGFQSVGILAQMLYTPTASGPYAEVRAAYRSWRSSETYYSLPPWEVWARGGYALQEKLLVNLSLYGLGARLLAPEVKVPPYVDISWGAQLQIMPFLSIFAEMNNLLNRRFYRWYGYVERPMDFRLGIWIKLG
ncbi:MAG: hypothetical protein RML92_04445 [Bacteroidia bacterium]|nr:hypothetical protein [Bacteroidia bacterium]